jgi:hypothetical protein
LPRDIAYRPKEVGGISIEENNFWNNLVKKEYYHANARDIKFAEVK